MQNNKFSSARITHMMRFVFLLAIKMEEAKIQKSLKEAAKKGHRDVCNILAKEIIHSRRAVNKIYSAKAQLNSVELTMKNQLGELNILMCTASEAAK